MSVLLSALPSVYMPRLHCVYRQLPASPRLHAINTIAAATTAAAALPALLPTTATTMLLQLFVLLLQLRTWLVNSRMSMTLSPLRSSMSKYLRTLRNPAAICSSSSNSSGINSLNESNANMQQHL